MSQVKGEVADIRTDTGIITDRGNFGTDPTHDEFAIDKDIGNGVADARAAFARADTYAQIYGLCVAPKPGVYVIATSLTITSPIRIIPGVVLKPSTGAVVTFNGGIYGDASSTALSTSGGGSFAYGASPRTERFGTLYADVLVPGAGSISYANLPTGGGTWANGGNLTLTGGNLSVDGAILANGAAGTQRILGFRTGGVNRWLFMANQTAESGANAGSALLVNARADDGSHIDFPISIVRAAGGTMTLSRPVQMDSTLAVTGASTLTGNVGIGAGINTAVGLYVRSAALAGTDQYGVYSAAPFTSAATNSAAAFVAEAKTAAASFTVGSLYGLFITDATKGAGSAITTQYGIRIQDQTQGATNYAIYTNAGLVRFGDRVLTTASVAGKAGLNVPHGTAPSSPVDGDIWTTTTGLYVRINGVTVGPLT